MQVFVMKTMDKLNLVHLMPLVKCCIFNLEGLTSVSMYDVTFPYISKIPIYLFLPNDSAFYLKIENKRELAVLKLWTTTEWNFLKLFFFFLFLFKTLVLFCFVTVNTFIIVPI